MNKFTEEEYTRARNADRDEALSGASMRKVMAEFSRVAERNVELESECNELKADLVWAARHWANTEVFGSDGKVLAYNDLKSPALRTYVDYDGTPEGLCAAVRAVRKGEWWTS